METRNKGSQGNLPLFMEDFIQDNNSKEVAFKKWNAKENIKYVHFLQQNQEEMENEASRRSFQVFKLMAKTIFRRSSEQCRTHHQKMIQRHGSVQGILNQFHQLHTKLEEELEVQSKFHSPAVETQHDSILQESAFEEKDSGVENMCPVFIREEDEEWWKCIEYILEPKIDIDSN